MALRKSSFFVRFIALGLAAHAYVGLRLIPDLGVGLPGALVGALLLLASCIVIPLGMLSRSSGRQPFGDRMAWIGLLAMGFFSSLFVLTVIRDAALLLAWFAALGGLSVPWPGLRQGSAIAVPALALLASAVGFYNARRRAPVVDVDLPIADLPAALEGYTIVQLSDIHVGPTIKRGYVQAIVDATNALAPDLIAITGDVVDGNVAQLRDHAAPLGQLRARQGVYLVTGNHEYYSGAAPWVAEFRRLGLHVLQNEHVNLKTQDATLVVAGVTDYSAGAFDPQQRSNPVRALAGAPAAAVRILLAHQPRSAVAAEPVGYDVQLSGHTHGGQFLPWRFFVRLQQPYVAGLHRHGRMWLYISRGTGYWGPPKRLGASSEITRLRLRRA